MAGPIPLSPLALPLPALPPVKGVKMAVGQAGIRYQGRTDVLLVEFAEGTSVAGVFTKKTGSAGLRPHDGTAALDRACP